MKNEDALPPVNAGIFGVGLDTYWIQFEGLENRLKGYLDDIVEKLRNFDINVINAGLVDNPYKARAAAELFREKKIEVIFLFVSTYALSHTVLPVAQQAKVPVIILNLQPAQSIAYRKINSIPDKGVMTGEWLANCQACAVPEIARVFNDAEIRYDIITGWLDDAKVKPKIGLLITGHKIYWNQFPGLKEMGEKMYAKMMNKLNDFADVISSGLVDTYESAVEKRLVFLKTVISTYC